MKNAKRLLTWLMVLVMALTGVACAETAPAETADDPVVLVFNGEEIHWSEIQETAAYLASSGYVESDTDYAMAYTTVLNQRVLQYKMKQLGLYEFTEEEEAALAADAAQQWEQAIQMYVDQNNTSENPTEDELATLRENAVAYFAAYGIDLEYLTNNIRNAAAYDKLEAYMGEQYGVSVTDEEVQALYQSYVDEDRSYFETSVPMYEYYTRYMGYEALYRPEGFRGVLQILLDVDEEIMKDYQDKLAAYEAQQAAANATAQPAAEGTAQPAADATEQPAEPVTLEEVEAARAAVIASRQTTLDEIFSRLDAGEKFIDLIPEYNIDPGMSNPANLASGYEVAADSILYDAPFVQASFDEKMTEVGAVSNPTVGSYGIYLVYYLRDVPGGPVEMSDEMAATLRGNLEESKLSQAYSELVPQWLSECEISADAEALQRLGEITVVDGQVVMEEAPAQAE